MSVDQGGTHVFDVAPSLTDEDIRSAFDDARFSVEKAGEIDDRAQEQALETGLMTGVAVLAGARLVCGMHCFRTGLRNDILVAALTSVGSWQRQQIVEVSTVGIVACPTLSLFERSVDGLGAVLRAIMTAEAELGHRLVEQLRVRGRVGIVAVLARVVISERAMQHV